MNQEKFAHLDGQVESLLQLLERIRGENYFLKEKLAKLTQERAHLLNIKEKTALDIKKIIKQIRETL